MQDLFGMNCSRWRTVNRYFSAFIQILPTDNFVVLCGDAMVQLVPDTVERRKRSAGNLDSRGVWEDRENGWVLFYDDYHPCDATL